MKIDEYLLVKAMEECNEVSQRLAKVLTFGMEQIQIAHDDKPEQNPLRLTNRERVLAEYADLLAVMTMAGFPLHVVSPAAIEAKFFKVQKYMKLSMERGTLETGGGPLDAELVSTLVRGLKAR